MKSDLPQAGSETDYLKTLPRFENSGGHLLVSSSEQMVSVLLRQIFKCGIWAILNLSNWVTHAVHGLLSMGKVWSRTLLISKPIFSLPISSGTFLVSLFSNSPIRMSFCLDGVKGIWCGWECSVITRGYVKGFGSPGSSVEASGSQTHERSFKVLAFIFSQPYSSHDGFGKGTNQRCCPLLEEWVLIGILAIKWVQDWNSSCYHSLSGWQLAGEWISQDNAEGYGLHFLGEVASHVERGERRRKWWHWCSSEEEGTNLNLRS